MNTYVLGAVKPNVKQAANDAGNLYGITTIYGVGQRDGISDHPKGLALDFMVPGDSAKGDQVAQYFVTNAARYGVHYIIWKQSIVNISERPGEGWRPVPDRGSVTANHFDHVHVSFNNIAVNPAATNASFGIPPIPGLPGLPFAIPNPSAPNPLSGTIDGLQKAIEGVQKLTDFYTFISNPHNWLRVAMFVGGTNLMILALIIMATGNSSVKAAARTAVKGAVKGATK